jgi:hypothetical protein
MCTKYWCCLEEILSSEVVYKNKLHQRYTASQFVGTSDIIVMVILLFTTKEYIYICLSHN